MNHLVGLLVVACAVTWLYSALLEPTCFTSHEGIYVYIRTQQVAKEIFAGRFPQSFPDAFYGAGFAFPRFYPPLTLFVSAGLVFVVGSVSMAVNLAFFLSVLLSGFTMYGMVVGMLRDRRVAVAASLLYVSLPYRFVDIFVRAALAEAWTFVWYPLIALGLWRCVTRRSMPWYLPFAICALALTHNITAVYFLAWCGVFTALAMAIRGWRIGLLPAAAVVLGIGIGLWFLLPQQAYISTVWVGDTSFMWTNAEHVQEHAVLPWQFFYSLPQDWFGESAGPGYRDAMSFELGIGQLLFVPAILFFARRFRWRRRALRSALVAGLLASSVAGWIVCILFMMYPAAFLAVLPGQFAFIQFPWRLLAISGFLAATGTAIIVARHGRRSRWLAPAFVGLSVAVVFLVPSFERTPNRDEAWTEIRAMAPEVIVQSGDRGYTVLGEYVPRDVDIASIHAHGLAPELYEAPRLVDGPGASVVSWRRDGPDFDLVMAAPAGATVRIPLFFYDFYVASGDSGARLETGSSSGMLAVRVPPGNATVSIRQTLSRVSRVGLALSGIAVVATCAVAYAFRDRRRRGTLAEPGSGGSHPGARSGQEDEGKETT